MSAVGPFIRKTAVVGIVLPPIAILAATGYYLVMHGLREDTIVHAFVIVGVLSAMWIGFYAPFVATVASAAWLVRSTGWRWSPHASLVLMLGTYLVVISYYAERM